MTQGFSWQLLVSGPEGEERVPLPEGETRIGRHPQNDVVLAHQFVSGQHALLACTPAGCTLTDLESTNGTTLDGDAVPPGEPQPLETGSTITIGPFTLTLDAIPIEAEVGEAPEEEEEPEAAEKSAEEPVEEAEEVAEVPAEEEVEPEPVTREEAVTAAPPPPATPPPVGPGVNGDILRPDPGEPLPGLGRHSERLLAYLPGIYHTDFMARFLAIFESILTPVEWTVDNFDLFLSPRTAPAGFLPWLANWYALSFDATWSEAKRRKLLAEAPRLYARRGTRWALARVLEIYTGREPEIVEFEEEDDPFSFTVRLPFARRELNVTLLEQIIDAHKPAHTMYSLRFAGE